MIKKLISLLAVSAVAAAGAPAGTPAGMIVGPSEPMAWRFAHPEAQILAGVDFRKLAETGDGRQIRNSL